MAGSGTGFVASKPEVAPGNMQPPVSGPYIDARTCLARPRWPCGPVLSQVNVGGVADVGGVASQVNVGGVARPLTVAVRKSPAHVSAAE